MELNIGGFCRDTKYDPDSSFAPGLIKFQGVNGRAHDLDI